MIESVGFQGNCQGKNGVCIAKSLFRCHGEYHRKRGVHSCYCQEKKLSGGGEESIPSKHRKWGRPTS